MRRSIAARAVTILLVSLIIAVLTSCGSARYQCTDHRASYFDTAGRFIPGSRGINEGFVLIPAAGDAGSFMLGQYVRISRGVIVERFSDMPEPIRSNLEVPLMNGLKLENPAGGSDEAEPTRRPRLLGLELENPATGGDSAP